MSSRRAMLPVVAVLLALAPLAAASGFLPPEGAQQTPAGEATVAHWLGPAPGEPGAPLSNLTAGATGTMWVGISQVGWNSSSNVTERTLYVNFTSASLAFEPASLVITLDARLSLFYAYASTNVTAPNATGPAAYAWSASLLETGPNGTVLVANSTFAGEIGIESAEVPAPPAGLPTSWLVAAGAVLVLGGGAAAYAARQRAIRRRMQAGPKRSQVMREMELEQKLEKARAKDPEQAVVIQQEIRAAEQVRERRRELQILDAKRADALKTLDLLKKRHEAGGLTKLQYDNMAAKKQADLARIEAEIAQMERDDAGAAA